MNLHLRAVAVSATLFLGALTTMSHAETAFLEITLTITPENRAAAAAVYEKYKQPFLDDVPGSVSKQLLIRDEDVQVLHGFDTVAEANAYLSSDLFKNDVVRELAPMLASDPEVRIYLAP